MAPQSRTSRSTRDRRWRYGRPTEVPRRSLRGPVGVLCRSRSLFHACSWVRAVRDHAGQLASGCRLCCRQRFRANRPQLSSLGAAGVGDAIAGGKNRHGQRATSQFDQRRTGAGSSEPVRVADVEPGGGIPPRSTTRRSKHWCLPTRAPTTGAEVIPGDDFPKLPPGNGGVPAHSGHGVGSARPELSPVALADPHRTRHGRTVLNRRPECEPAPPATVGLQRSRVRWRATQLAPGAGCCRTETL